jgi:hypothetical protein
MAPKVSKGWKYDKTVDVYSFAILLWEICSLYSAFSAYSEDEMHKVFLQDKIAEPV